MGQVKKTFSHSGDLGDIIYALPAIRASGGGDLVIYDHPGRTAHGMTREKMERIKPLLVMQPYIGDVVFSSEILDTSLNGFRDHYHCGNLADMHLASQGYDWIHRQKRWIDVDYAIKTCEVIVHRSMRYKNELFPWERIVRTYSGMIGFIGHKEEHIEFCSLYGNVPYVEAGNFLDMARIIEGAKLFIGNQSAPCAVASGMKKSMILQVCPERLARDHCIYQRMNCILGWDAKIELPDIEKDLSWT